LFRPPLERIHSIIQAPKLAKSSWKSPDRSSTRIFLILLGSTRREELDEIIDQARFDFLEECIVDVIEVIEGEEIRPRQDQSRLHGEMIGLEEGEKLLLDRSCEVGLKALHLSQQAIGSPDETSSERARSELREQTVNEPRNVAQGRLVAVPRTW
jgi:hypothetical protein